MTARELKYTYIEEAMSILDNEELMEKALKAIRRCKKASGIQKTEEEPLREAFKRIDALKKGKTSARPIEELLDEI